MRFLLANRGGVYHRVADPDWDDPLDPTPAVPHGGRWNPPRSFPVTYLTESVALARMLVEEKLAGEPYGPEDLEPDRAPILVETLVPNHDFVDVVSDGGIAAVGLPESYPKDAAGRTVPWETCQPIGLIAWDAGEAGIACRSAVDGAHLSDEELAWFARDGTLGMTKSQRFDEWFF